MFICLFIRAPASELVGAALNKIWYPLSPFFPSSPFLLFTMPLPSPQSGSLGAGVIRTFPGENRIKKTLLCRPGFHSFASLLIIPHSDISTCHLYKILIHVAFYISDSIKYKQTLKMVVRSYDDECQYIERINNHCWRIKKGFQPNMNVEVGYSKKSESSKAFRGKSFI